MPALLEYAPGTPARARRRDRPRRRRRRDAERGFTLVEVVVAFAVLALVLPLLLRTMSGALRAADRARDGAVAVMLAESALARLGIDRPLRQGTAAGTFENGFGWRLLVVPDAGGPSGAPEAPLVAYDVTLTVSSTSGDELTLRTLKLVPRQLP